MPFTLLVGDVIIIKSDERNRGKWTLGIVQELYTRERCMSLKNGKATSFRERRVEHLFPLELSCDIGNRQTTKTTTELNAEATEFRLKRDAAVAVRLRNQMVVDD
jgi:hypothetical protein